MRSIAFLIKHLEEEDWTIELSVTVARLHAIVLPLWCTSCRPMLLESQCSQFVELAIFPLLLSLESICQWGQIHVSTVL